MKLNLEKNFKFLFKKKVSFTMAALTIFAITGGISFADDPPTVEGNKKLIEENEKKIKENKKSLDNFVEEIQKRITKD